LNIDYNGIGLGAFSRFGLPSKAASEQSAGGGGALEASDRLTFSRNAPPLSHHRWHLVNYPCQ